MAKGWTAQIDPGDLNFLEKRGAISQRGRSPFSRSAVLHREIALLREILRRNDPRKTANLPEPMYQLAARLLPEPWTLKLFEIDEMPALLKRAPAFEAELAAAGIEPAAFLDAIAALNFVERVALLDHALELQAPAAAAAALHEP